MGPLLISSYLPFDLVEILLTLGLPCPFMPPPSSPPVRSILNPPANHFYLVGSCLDADLLFIYRCLCFAKYMLFMCHFPLIFNLCIQRTIFLSDYLAKFNTIGFY